MDLLQQSAESLAGRIAYLELTPFILPKYRAWDTAPRTGSGLAADSRTAFLAADDLASFQWRIAFIQDLSGARYPGARTARAAETLHRFWRMLATIKGQLLNAARLAAGPGRSGQTVPDISTSWWICSWVRRLQPWTANPAKRLVRVAQSVRSR